VAEGPRAPCNRGCSFNRGDGGYLPIPTVKGTHVLAHHPPAVRVQVGQRRSRGPGTAADHPAVQHDQRHGVRTCSSSTWRATPCTRTCGSRPIEELQADGLETTVAPNARFREEYAERATSIRHLSDGTHGQDGGWAAGSQPDGQHEFGYLTKPEPLGDEASVPAPDPALYATYDGDMGKPSGPSLGTENRPGREDHGRDQLSSGQAVTPRV
jgi:hypothetical protein